MSQITSYDVTCTSASHRFSIPGARQRQLTASLSKTKMLPDARLRGSDCEESERLSRTALEGRTECRPGGARRLAVRSCCAWSTAEMSKPRLN